MAKIIEILEMTIFYHLDSRAAFEDEIFRVCSMYWHRISTEEHFERIYHSIYCYVMNMGVEFEH